MRMTIDDARYCLENGGFCSASCKYFSVGDPNCEDNVRKIAIDTMRKYQKIQEIVNNTDYIQGDVIRYKMICGVLEDET